ncbi:hypothetical protein PLESTB_000075700 [Pleodorina starrii]|uniref:Peptidase M48 domain-containing protein n=1 Tax=Pleodorina starrii TaxID=330485 RepID=A0A9W6EWP9_9CHLO|nr:hypothetical protein PLESTM_000071300 [Pleodorina starrii]GLC48253.1 hypothetical protein PLESTB_000075700 [Pleodorina starrii]
MPGRGAFLLEAAACGFRAAFTGNAAARSSPAPSSILASTQATATSAAAAAAAATPTSATSGQATLQLLSVHAAQRLPTGVAASAAAAVAAQETSAVPWVARGLRLWRASGVAAGAAAGPGHSPTTCSAWGRPGTVLTGTWHRSGVHGGAWRPAAAVGSAAAAAGVSGASLGLSRRPLGLLAGAGMRMALPLTPSNMTVAAAAAGAGAAAVVAALAPWAPLAGASAVRSVWRDSRGYEHFQGRGHTWSPNNPRLLYGTAALAVSALAYYLYSLETVPYTGRRHAIMLVSPYREQWMGKMGFEQFKALARADHQLLPDSHPDVQRVARLGRAIAAVAADGGGGGDFEHMRGLQWEFAVINDGMVNAAVLPGGKVIVFSGLLRLLDRNDDELAAVLAHEVGHVLARHPAENMSTLNVWLLINTALRLTLGFALPDVAMYLALILPNSRKNEHEADVIGLRLMARACFDPAAAPSMLDKLNRAEKEMKQGRALGGSLPPFLSTHPLTTDRVKLLEGDLQQAYKLFDESGCGSVRSDLRRGVEAWLGGGWGGLGTDEGGGFRSL